MDFFQVSEQMELDSRNLSVSHTAQILKNSLSPWKILLCSWAAPRVIFVGSDRPCFWDYRNVGAIIISTFIMVYPTGNPLSFLQSPTKSTVTHVLLFEDWFILVLCASKSGSSCSSSSFIIRGALFWCLTLLIDKPNRDVSSSQASSRVGLVNLKDPIQEWHYRCSCQEGPGWKLRLFGSYYIYRHNMYIHIYTYIYIYI